MLETVQKTKTITKSVTYWACNIPSHTHTSPSVAQCCIGRRARSNSKKRLTTEQMGIRRLKVFIAVISSPDRAKVATAFGVTVTRIRQLEFDAVLLMRERYALDYSHNYSIEAMRGSHNKLWLERANGLIKEMEAVANDPCNQKD